MREYSSYITSVRGAFSMHWFYFPSSITGSVSCSCQKLHKQSCIQSKILLFNVLFSLFFFPLFLLFLHFSLFLAAWKTSPFFATNRIYRQFKIQLQPDRSISPNAISVKRKSHLFSSPPLSRIKFLNAVESKNLPCSVLRADHSSLV